MKKARYIIPIILLIIFITSCTKCDDCGYQPPLTTTIPVGALLSLTGSGASSGQSSQVSIGFAQQDINTWLSSINKNVRISITYADTKTDTAEALTQLKIFYDKGIRLVIGPYSSAEVAAIKPFADLHGILIVSPSSVAVSLAIPDDNIFRFVSCDVIQGQAMTAMLLADSIRAIAPLIRNDVWGNDLLASTTSDYYAKGGTIAQAEKYDPKATDFSATLSHLNTTVGNLLGPVNPDQAAVYLCSFGEGSNILSIAGNYPQLKKVPWYGSSAFAQNASLTADTAAARFAYTHLLPCPVYGLDEEARGKWQPLQQRIKAIIGRDPEVYALTAYDAVWVGMKTYLVTGSRPEIETFKFAFVQEASTYFGASGNTTLDANGDRAFGNYDFWAVNHNPSGYFWQIVAKYNSATGTLSRIIKK